MTDKKKSSVGYSNMWYVSFIIRWAVLKNKEGRFFEINILEFKTF